MKYRLLLVLALTAAALGAQQYSQRDVMIPMRDGVRLHTLILTPPGAHRPLPFLITRTPYGASARLLSNYPVMAATRGYIFVMQDIRGRYRSEGRFVMQRPPRDRSNPKSIDEGTDTYDTIAWLLANVPNNNGRAGLVGISYGGWLTTMALLEPHPALKAASEQASPDNMFVNDDFHHNGAFRLSYGFEYAAMMETGKTNFTFHFPVYDTYGWYLQLGSLANVNRGVLHGELPTWNNFVAHPNDDSFWEHEAVTPYLRDLTLKVPNLNVAGWWDQEDFVGPQRIYQALETHDAAHHNFIVIGPWNHGGWAHGKGDSLGPVQFGSNTSEYFRAQIQARWFAYWLRGEGTLPFQEAMTFQTGSNRWVAYDAWPPRSDAIARRLYFQANRQLSFSPPTDAANVQPWDSYISDPAHPVPYRHRPIEETYGPGSRWYTWQTEDQRFTDNRMDTLAWSTPVLDHEVCIAGQITAHLYASTTGSDSDWIAKLIDVYPETYPAQPAMAGYELMIVGDVLRGRFRNSLSHPEPVEPDQIVAYNLDLHTNNHCFLPGHRIMVQVQSTWFPLIDRNPQTYVPNIFQAKDSDFVKATQRIYRSASYPSNLEVQVVTSPGGR
ncbi:MAG: CocE/NonD family hydrolase [Terriglobales bacterium]